MSSLESRGVSFRKSLDEIDYGAEVQLRNNGSRRLQQAVPNPYSNSELDWTMPQVFVLVYVCLAVIGIATNIVPQLI